MHTLIKNTFLILLLIGHISFPSQSSCQKFDKKYFKQTDWFSYNKDSFFYKADTIKIIKHSSLAPDWSRKLYNTKVYSESEDSYLHSGDFISFGFDTRKKMHIKWTEGNYRNWLPGGQWTWSFNKRDNTITFFEWNHKWHYSFKPLSEKSINIESEYVEHKGKLKTIELTVVKIRRK